MNETIRSGILPGYSKKADDPEILRGVAKFQWMTRLILLTIAAAPPLICAFIANGRYFAVGAWLCIVFLLAYLIWAVKRIARKPWEGVVTEKFTKSRHYFSVTSSIASYSRSTKYYLKVRFDNGMEKKKKVDNAVFYETLNAGDWVRFLPKLNGYYEKYDKSHDPYLICLACLKKNTPANDRCERCSVPLLK